MAGQRAADGAGTLYIVPTPIGNLEDITLRALRVLREAGFIAAEDTRHTRKLLTHFSIHPARLFSYREHNAHVAGPMIAQLLEEGISGALVSDAGMPGVSDPGQELVAHLLGRGATVTVLPGPTAFVTALVGSGLPARPFTFTGFLSREERERRAELERLADRPDTLVFYEAPHRMRATLRSLLEEFGPRTAVVARELSKVHEAYHRGTIEELADMFAHTPPRGEIAIIVAGASRDPDGRNAEPDGDVSGLPVPLTLAEHVMILEERGATRKEAMRQAAQARGLTRRDVYQALLGRP